MKLHHVLATIAAFCLSRPAWSGLPVAEDWDGDGIANARDEDPYLARGLRPRLKAEVRRLRGSPTLFINGRATTLVANSWGDSGLNRRAASYEFVRLFQRFAQAGVHIYYDHAELRLVWKKDGSIDLEYADAKWMRVLEGDPEGYVLLWLNVNPPKWWLLKHREELVRFAFGLSSKWVGYTGVSHSSALWKREVTPILVRYINHLLAGPYGDRIIGCKLGAGPERGFYHWHDFHVGINGAADFCPAQQNNFRRWLMAKYRAVDRLRAAWRKPKLTFETAAVPRVERRMLDTWESLRDPRQLGDVLDHARFAGQLIVDNAAYFSGVVKRVTQGHWIVGIHGGASSATPYGCTHDYGRELTALGLHRLDTVDFVDSMFQYTTRKLGVGDSTLRPAMGSLRLHNKLFMLQEDTRTYLTKLREPGTRDAQWVKSLHLCETADDSRELLKRNFATAVTRHSGYYWWSLGCGAWYDAPEFLNPLGLAKVVADRQLTWPRRYVAQVAVVTDPESTLYAAGRGEINMALINDILTQQLPRTGAIWETYLIDDLGRDDFPAHKVYLFLNALSVGPSKREMIHRRLAADHATAVWFYAPGAITPNGLSREAAQALTGHSLSWDMRKAKLGVKVGPGDHPFLKGIGADLTWQTKRPFGPVFYASGQDATVVGETLDGKPGLVVRRMGAWRSVYVAAPAPPASVLRNIFRDSGVHVYTDAGDNFYANDRLLMFHSAHGGRRRVRLPQRADAVFDIFNRKLLARSVEEWSFELEPNTTRWFYAGPSRALNEMAPLLREGCRVRDVEMPATLKGYLAQQRPGDGVILVANVRSAASEIAEFRGRRGVRTHWRRGQTALVLRLDASRLGGRGPHDLEVELLYAPCVRTDEDGQKAPFVSVIYVPDNPPLPSGKTYPAKRRKLATGSGSLPVDFGWSRFRFRVVAAQLTHALEGGADLKIEAEPGADVFVAYVGVRKVSSQR